jgi:tripartite-type tricarboxylate transporter receptor subunit TctC
LFFAVVTILLGAAFLPAKAQYPDRPVKIIVPNAAGGGSDVLARLMAQKLGERLNAQFVIENRAGGGTVNGTRAVVQSDADGYTLLMTQTSLTITAAIHPSLGFDVRRDLTPISIVGLGPNGFFVHPSVPAKDFQEFMTYAKASPGKLSYSSAGVGTASHMTMELLKTMGGIDMQHVPARGMAPALVDLLGGQVQTLFGSLPSSLGEHRNGRIRLLAVAERTRWPAVPEIPTVEELGFPGFEAGNWTGLLGPANLDPKIVALLNDHIRQIVNTPEMKEQLFQLGFGAIASTPKEFTERIDRDIARWTEVAKQANVKGR